METLKRKNRKARSDQRKEEESSLSKYIICNDCHAEWEVAAVYMRLKMPYIGKINMKLFLN